MRFRVKQIDENTFIPQCKEWYDFDWESIDRDISFTWYRLGDNYCQVDSLEKAKEIIDKRKFFLLERKKYPKYYKV